MREKIKPSDNSLMKERYYTGKAILRQALENGNGYVYGTTRTVKQQPSGYNLLASAVVRQTYLDYVEYYVRLLKEQEHMNERKRKFEKWKNEQIELGNWWLYEREYMSNESSERVLLYLQDTIKKLEKFFNSPEYEIYTSIPGEIIVRKAKENARRYFLRKIRRRGGNQI